MTDVDSAMSNHGYESDKDHQVFDMSVMWSCLLIFVSTGIEMAN